VTNGPSVVERVRRLRGVSYVWRDGHQSSSRVPAEPGTRELGVLAQEVEAVFPEAVRTRSDGVKTVDYMGLVPVLIEAVKELDARLAAVEAGDRDH
jgi:hypothetical protein